MVRHLIIIIAISKAYRLIILSPFNLTHNNTYKDTQLTILYSECNKLNVHFLVFNTHTHVEVNMNNFRII